MSDHDFTCEECSSWLSDGKTAEGECRANPPQLLQMPQFPQVSTPDFGDFMRGMRMAVVSAHPRTLATHWCDSFCMKEADQAEAPEEEESEDEKVH